jgi:hypothetical protein
METSGLGSGNYMLVSVWLLKFATLNAVLNQSKENGLSCPNGP